MSFGALGDGIHDDTAAVQRAVNSGKPVVWFPKATYVINGTVDIPATVREMAFLWASVYRTGSDSPNDGPAMFRVAEPSTQPLFLHRNHNAGGIFLDHEAYRPVVFEDVIAWFHHDQWRAKIAGVRFPAGCARRRHMAFLPQHEARRESRKRSLPAVSCILPRAEPTPSMRWRMSAPGYAW